MNMQQAISEPVSSSDTAFGLISPLSDDDGNPIVVDQEGDLPAEVKRVTKPSLIITDLTPHTIGAGECNPYQSLWTRKGHVVQPSFREHFMTGVPDQDVAFNGLTFGHADSLVSATDQQISRAFPPGYVFEDHVWFIGLLDTLTKQQCGGGAGALQHLGPATFMYVRIKGEVVVARVLRNSTTAAWHYFAAPFGDASRYSAGRRFFSAAVA